MDEYTVLEEKDYSLIVSAGCAYSAVMPNGDWK